MIFFVNFLLTIDIWIAIIRSFNLYWLGPNGSRLFLYKLNFIIGGDSNALYNH